jgi:hypothetical protein
MSSGMCEPSRSYRRPITAAECLLAYDSCGSVAYGLGRSDESASQYARFLGIRFDDVTGDEVIHCDPSNFLSCDGRDYGLAFCMDRALQIANEA